jgi:hypothetical protein
VTHPPRDPINLQEVTTRTTTARHVVAGFSAALPALAELWDVVDSALADTAALAAEFRRLTAELRAVRLDCANLLAAGRAVLTAQHDGEPDPLFYLRDELSARSQLPPGQGRRA